MVKALRAPVLCANVYGAGERRVPECTPWIVKEVAGVKIGIFGLLTTNMKNLSFPGNTILFQSTHRGQLTVTKRADFLELNFPADQPELSLPPDGLIDAIGKRPLEVWKGRTDYLLLYASPEDISDIRPNFEALKAVKARGLIVTAPGYECDFVSRFFAPAVGVNEDPVTGSAHTTLTPFWAHRLNQLSFEAVQLSLRGGYLKCTLAGDRVLIAGRATTYLVGEIFIN